MSDQLPEPPEPKHEELPKDEDVIQRGDEPSDPIGVDPPEVVDPEPDPEWQPDPNRVKEWRDIAGEVSRERRPRREDVYPYLLIRAVTSGDRGQRRLWPPTVCWESPDILLMDAADQGPFDLNRLVVSPTAGRSYRVFVRIWNLGLLPAVGVHVKAWAVNPGFFGTGNQNDPYYAQNLIGGQWTDLTDRTRRGCTAVVELDRTWDIDPNALGHHCLLAEVSCPLDLAGGLLLSNDDRHVGQRNLEILAGTADAKELFAMLGNLVPEKFTLELTHAGPAAAGTLIALGGGRLPDGRGEFREVQVPTLKEIPVGVSTGTVVHLLTAFTEGGRTVVAPSTWLAEASGVRPGGSREGRPHPFDRGGGTRRLLQRLGPKAWSDAGFVTDAPLAEALLDGLVRTLDANSLEAGALAERMGGQAGSHTCFGSP